MLWGLMKRGGRFDRRQRMNYDAFNVRHEAL